jgi:prepilin-type N-terminal cleavage/methylation domain-containing protein
VNRQRGFSFIEVSAVIVVLALLAAIILPRLANARRSFELTTYRASLNTMATEARRRALQTGQPQTVRFDGNALALSSGTVQDQDTQTTDADGTTTEAIRRLTTPEDTSWVAFRRRNEDVTQDDWRLTCYPDGSCDEVAAEFTQSGRRWLFRTEPRSGRPIITEGNLSDLESTSWEAGDIERRVG